MKSTQKKQNNPKKKAQNQWQIPDNMQVIITKGAKQSIDSALEKGQAPTVITDKDLQKKKPANPTNAPRAVTKVTNRPKKAVQKRPLTLKEAIIAEIRDRIKTLRLSIQLNSEDIIKALIGAGLMSLFALLQTTFFVKFAPMGSVPDLMLIFVLAMGVFEGEKWGAIMGIVGAFVIQCLGWPGNAPELLSLIYMPVGCISGLLSKYYLRHTVPVNTVYVLVACILRSIITVITSLVVLNASFGDIILEIAIPEFFSTAVISPLPFVIVWLSYKPFHKTRAERTDSELI